MSIKITDLPPEMIEQIFGHLQHHERLVVSCTCKAWRKLVFSPKFCKRLYLHLRSADDIVLKLRDGTVYELCRNAVISCESIPDDHKSSLNNYLQNAPLESLNIVTAKATAKWILEHNLAQMEMLETLHLDLRDCDGEMLRISHQTLKNATFKRMWTIEIDCPNLSAINSHLSDEKCVDFIKSLRGQLQSLMLFSEVKQVYTALSDVEWDNLRELHMNIVPRGNDLEILLERMPCLKKLVLHDNYTLPAIGKEFRAAKSLSELVLIKVNINAEFNKSLERLTLLESLMLINIIFTHGKEQCLKSSSIKRLTLCHRLRNPLPQFPNLKILNLQCEEFELCDILKDLCIYYPKLEQLSFGVAPGEIGVLQTESGYRETKSLSHLKKMEFLKTVQLNRIATELLDWSTCNDNRIESLRLDGCSIDGKTAQQLVQVFKQLRQLFLDHCYLRQPRTDVFELDENCTYGLRSQLPGCTISYYDCHIEELHDACGGGGKDVI
ncbi:uncharacterized protein LOC135712826 [Ochlerotatus camptorhynchus]|uniref:uncharacterized protein LOC135712826 n=1 Tax=Ochlerotatus camptorhynchus TaxID=644619 RepID=UPI0031DD0D0C